MFTGDDQQQLILSARPEVFCCVVRRCATILRNKVLLLTVTGMGLIERALGKLGDLTDHTMYRHSTLQIASQ
jgi:hypothetical protein